MPFLLGEHSLSLPLLRRRLPLSLGVLRGGELLLLAASALGRRVLLTRLRLAEEFHAFRRELHDLPEDLQALAVDLSLSCDIR